MSTLITSFLMVALGEMGDKSQLLALALTARYPAGQVMFGVVLAAALIQGLAVCVGTCLAEILPLTAVSVVAGLSFLFFALWTLWGEESDDEGRKAYRFCPLLTVVLTFCLAEMGDKTQLATVALAAGFRDPWPVLVGATAGMVVADGLGVFVGDLLLRRMSPHLVSYVTAGIFAAFGFLTLYRAMGASPASLAILGGLALAMAVASRRLVRGGKPQTPAAGTACGGAEECDAGSERLC